MQQVEAIAPATLGVQPRAPMSMAWLGVVPFFSFAALFLLLPTAYLVVGAFQDSAGHFTLTNLAGLWDPGIRSAYWISFEVSAASAILGAILGFALAWAVVLGGLPGGIRPVLMTFSGVASNFAYGLTGSTLNLVTILLYAQIRGDVLHDPHLGYALALGMVAITGVSNALYILLRTRSERWLR